MYSTVSVQLISASAAGVIVSGISDRSGEVGTISPGHVSGGRGGSVIGGNVGNCFLELLPFFEGPGGTFFVGPVDFGGGGGACAVARSSASAQTRRSVFLANNIVRW